MSNIIIEAARFAAHMHRDQKRKFSDDPYFVHLMRVANKVMLATNSTEEMIVAAYLHDVIEDVEGGSALLTAQLYQWAGYMCGSSWSYTNSANVLVLVNELTNKYTKETHPTLNRKARKKKEHERLAGISVQAKTIKLADRIDNVQDFLRTGNLEYYYIRESEELLKVLEGGDQSLRVELQLLLFPQTMKV